MELKEFMEEVKGCVEDTLGEGYDLSIKDVLKNNGQLYHGLEVKKSLSNIAPVLYLDGYYEQYEKGLGDIEGISQEVVRIFRQHEKNSVDMSFVTDFENVRDNIMVKAINFEGNSKLLEGLVYEKYLDLAMVYYIGVDFPVDGAGCIMVKKEMLKTWGIRKKELRDAAKRNMSNQEYMLENIFDLIIKINGLAGVGAYPEEMCGEGGDVFVLSNPDRLYGGRLLYDIDKLSKITDKLGKHYYIIPSSIHELILIRDRLDLELNYIRQMVHEVNRTTVVAEEVLSDNVYVYDDDSKSVRIA